MSEVLFDSASNQRRIMNIVTGLTRVVFHPVAQRIIEGIGRVDLGGGNTGLGLSEYRSGPSLLSSHPSKEGEKPAEISFSPTVPALEIDGTIYWHGEGSNAVLKGEVLGFFFDRAQDEDGKFVNYLEVQRRDGQLVLGHRIEGMDELAPPTETLVDEVETKIIELEQYIQSLKV